VPVDPPTKATKLAASELSGTPLTETLSSGARQSTPVRSLHVYKFAGSERSDNPLDRLSRVSILAHRHEAAPLDPIAFWQLLM